MICTVWYLPSDADWSLATLMDESFKHNRSTAAKRDSNSNVSTGNTDANNICLAVSYPANGWISFWLFHAVGTYIVSPIRACRVDRIPAITYPTYSKIKKRIE